MRSSFGALRLPTVDPYSAVGPGEMLSTLYCVMAYIVACVGASRMVLLGPFTPWHTVNERPIRILLECILV